MTSYIYIISLWPTTNTLRAQEIATPVTNIWLGPRTEGEVYYYFVLIIIVLLKGLTPLRNIVGRDFFALLWVGALSAGGDQLGDYIEYIGNVYMVG